MVLSPLIIYSGVYLHRPTAKSLELLIAILPSILFPLSFIVLERLFIISMSISTTLLAILASIVMLRRGIYRGVAIRSSTKGILINAALGSIALYIAFLLGGLLSIALGMWGYVEAVYRSIRETASSHGSLLPLFLAVIGASEEIFWRGYIQSYIFGEHLKRPLGGVMLTAIYYTAVHIPTANPPLIAGALIVGLAMGFIAHRSGILCSALSHIIWLELVVIHIPVDRIFEIYSIIP